MVLVVALLVVLLLSALLLEFNYEARVSAVAADNYYRSRQALRVAESGVAAAKAALRRPRSQIAEDPDLQALLNGETAIAVGGGVFRIRVASENGKININRLDTAQGREARWRMDQFLRLIDLLNARSQEEEPLPYSIVPSIIDWIDPDDEVTRLPFIERDNEGAESAYYRRLDPSYEAKNAPFDAIEELLLVRGVTPESFWGRRGGEGLGGVDGAAGFRDLATVYGDGRVDVNSAPPLVLMSLAENMPPDAVAEMVEIRKQEPFRHIGELIAVPGMTREVFNRIRPFITVEPAEPYYMVEATGEVHGIRRRLEVVIRKEKGDEGFTVVRRREW